MLLRIVQTINAYLSDYVLLLLLVLMGLWYSVRTRFAQIRYFKEGVRRVFGSLSLHGGKHESGMSSFQALATAIAAQVGTGNIVGASGAILMTRLVHHMRDNGIRYGLQTMCEGGGMANATILELLS